MLGSYNSVSSSSVCHARLGGQERLCHGTRVTKPTGANPKFLVDQCRRLQKHVVCQAAKGTFSSFDDMLGAYDTVLLDAYATWCGPCQYMSTLLSQSAAGLKAMGVQTIKLDTEKYPAIATRLGVSGLPTLILFRKGKPVARVEGAFQNQRDLDQWVRSNLSQ